MADDRRCGFLDVPGGRRLHPSSPRRAWRRDRADEASGHAIGCEHVRVAAHGGEVQPRARSAERGGRGGVVQDGDGVDVDAEPGGRASDVEAPRARMHGRDGVRRDGPRDEPGGRAGEGGGPGGGHAADHQEHGQSGEPSQQQLESLQGTLRGDLGRPDDHDASGGRGGVHQRVQGDHRA